MSENKGQLGFPSPLPLILMSEIVKHNVGDGPVVAGWHAETQDAGLIREHHAEAAQHQRQDTARRRGRGVRGAQQSHLALT